MRGLPLVVVSGLPRAGTSLMMQMLAAGGLAPLADGARAPDTSNPRGYFEWQPILRIAAHPERIEEARGHAVKVISALLPALPATRCYRVVFLERDAEEIEASQRAMLVRRGAAPDGLDADALARHVERVRAWLAAEPQRARFAVLPVAHRDAIEKPLAVAMRVRDFLADTLRPQRLALDAAAMAAAVDPALYRARR